MFATTEQKTQIEICKFAGLMEVPQYRDIRTDGIEVSATETSIVKLEMNEFDEALEWLIANGFVVLQQDRKADGGVIEYC